jgi:hypothetical protein
LVDETPPDDLDDGLVAPDSYVPDPESDASDLHAFDPLLDTEDEQDEPPGPTFTVTNPPGTVTVSAFMDGSVRQIDLSQKVTAMTEGDLAEEIVVIARLATQDARAAQYAFMLDGMREHGHDDNATRDFLTRDLDLPSPEDATADRAQTFTMRYAGDHD